MKIIQRPSADARRKMSAIVWCLLSGLLLGQALYAQPTRTLSQDEEIKLVWTSDYGQGEQVYFSSYEKDNWTAPVQLSDSTELVFHSAVSTGNDGAIWAVWTRQDKQRSYIEFTVNSASRWAPPRQIETGLDSNKAATVIVDKANTPWIAWEGVEEMYSDVFWSRWNGIGWDAAVKAHPQNEVPDINPTLALDGSGQIVLSWQTFADGKYVTVWKTWDGSKWQAVSSDQKTAIKEKKSLTLKKIPAVPGFIKEPRQATLFMKGNGGAGSIPLSSF